ncbi:hypothetical protein D3227_26860 [Mesorhizobium waimense]|uniref:Uncharacterized protein n=2 Tax=Mesorhizobium waimense TaxID=1300307 RepID=A0A3A5KNF1_9HYPH|nr:hypothetical protein D3227_26860 [Mesorhizobium waimense]
MDTLGDASIALLRFENHGLGSEEGEKYLRLYGTLQAIILQQDAIKTIYEVYLEKLPRIDRDSAWKNCRRIRNLATGHPLDAQYGKLRVFVSRRTISTEGFDLLTYQAKDSVYVVEHVDLTANYTRYKDEALERIEDIEASQR